MTSALITATFAAPLEVKAESAPAVSGVAAPQAWLQEWGGLPAVAGPAVTPTSAMSVPAVHSAVGLISGAIGSLPMKLYRELDGGGRTEAKDHPAYGLCHDDANPWTSAGQLRAQLVTDALLRGAGYGLVRRDQKGEPYEILRLQPEAVAIVLDQLTGEPFFRITTAIGHEIVSHTDIVHVPAPCTLDGITGIAPIQRARNAISLALALEAHASRIFKNGARPSGVITAPALKTREGAQSVGITFVKQHSDENSGGVAVLYNGHTFTPTEFKSVDQEFMAQRAFQVHEIAKAFNVPPTLIGELAKATLSNSEQMGRQFLTMTLMPWICTIRDAFGRTLLSRDERKSYSIDFVTDGLLQADSPARAQFYAAMVSNGIFTPNEIRRLENKPDHPDGNRLGSPHTASGATPPAALIAPAPEPSLA